MPDLGLSQTSKKSINKAILKSYISQYLIYILKNYFTDYMGYILYIVYIPHNMHAILFGKQQIKE